jgi:hypothetical protein
MGAARERWLFLFGLGLVLALLSVVAVRELRRDTGVSEPSRQVGRLLPRAVRYLEVSNAAGGGWSLFCGIRYLGNSPLAEQFDLYVWEACQEYRAAGRRLDKFTSWSVPAVITFVRTASGYRPRAERQPGDGSDYAPDIHRMFPDRVETAIWSMDGSVETGPGTVAGLFAGLDRRARQQLLARRR